MKKKILEEMAKEVSSDTLKATKRAVTATARGITYLVTAPIVGHLDSENIERIYSGRKGLINSSKALSTISSFALYTACAATFSKYFPEFPTQALVYSTTGFFLLETFCRLEIGMSSVVGILPDLAVDYLFKKYDNAKNKIGADGK